MASPEEIGDLLKNYKEESDNIEQSCIELVYHMGGGLTLNEAWTLSAMQRNKITKYINRMYKEREEQLTGKKTL